MDASKAKKVEYQYDRDGDVLYASLGRPRPSITEETVDGILIRRAIDTNEVVGFTIVNFLRRKKCGQIRKIPHFPGVRLPEF